MKKALISLAAAATLACGPKAEDARDANVSQTGSTNDPAAVQRTIDSTLVAFGEALKKGDTATSLRMYADDAIVLAPNSKVMKGRAEIAKWHAGMFAAMSVPAAKFTTDDIIVAGDYASETGAYDMTVQPQGGKGMRDVGKYVSVWKKQPDGSWKMVRDAFNSDMPAP
jgi:uncharacterized protein (TIGR02246 family)